MTSLKREGFGVSIHGNGTTIYAGYYKKGKPFKRGMFLFPDGTRYAGELDTFKREGKGMYTFVDRKTKFIGRFKQDWP